MRKVTGAMLAMLLVATAAGNEVTVKNDSLTDFGNGVIVTGFAIGEKAAVWLTSPCAGTIVAAQIYWHSATGTAAQDIENAIEIYRAGTFPQPGLLQTTIGGPVLTDGVFNEYRYLDENNTIPLSVAVTQNEVFIVSFQFANAPPAPDGPSLVRDTDGNPGGRDAIDADLGGGTFAWFDSKTLGVNGDWAIRAVVDCQAVSTSADVAVTASAMPAAYLPGQGLTYSLVISNAGPANSPNTTIVDTFPGAFANPSWTCTPAGGASCVANGTGNIVATNVSLPVGSSVTYSVNGTVANGTTGLLSNNVTAAVGAPSSDPVSSNNTATTDLLPDLDRIFADGFGG